MKERKQVGFIKTFSSKQISYHQDEPSQFSYFKIKAGRDEDQFSPYKIQNYDIQPKQALFKPPLPRPKMQNAIKTYQTQKNIREKKVETHAKEQAKNIIQRAKQNILFSEENKKASKQKLQKNIGNIRNKIDELDAQLKHLQLSKQKKRRQSQQKLRQINGLKSKKFLIESSSKSSSTSSDQNQESNKIQSIPSCKNNKHNQNNQYRYNYHIEFNETKQKQQSLRNYQEEEQDPKQLHKQNFITFNSRTTKKPPLVIKQYSSESSDEKEQNQQNVFTEQRRKETQNIISKEYEDDPINSKKDVFRNKGGVCFDIDVKQFTEPIIKSNREQKPLKRQNPSQKRDKKAQILKRRQQAKLYDKIARKAVFNTYK